MLVEEVDDWFASLDQRTAELVADAIDQLEGEGPTLRSRAGTTRKGHDRHGHGT